ncbi:hypothetical protein DHEL01_v204440 [Diaporthe helianthi]|uniref:BZIP domain-containing protein n=1 Tax=Diaporthe helianthi TaxID=158607 RepID=A0A2P5I3W1_DIAHE|nr:hypothetical protein DHEL01_v204440 [Diaporthe helianthi]
MFNVGSPDNGVGPGGAACGQHMQQISPDEEKKKHRRLQNKTNQRARRQRLKEQRAADETEGQGPHRRQFRVMRWRLGAKPHPVQSEAAQVSTTSSVANIYTFPRSEPAVARMRPISPRDQHLARRLNHLRPADSPQDVVFPLPADSLLHLIQFNVARALTINKNVVQSLSMYAALQNPDPLSCVSLEVKAITRHGGPVGQTPLSATHLQMSRQHSPWIGMLPWSRVRDNLIEHHAHFDHWDFLLNLVGDELHGAYSEHDEHDDHDDDEVTSGRQGLIVWGEPHDPSGWEVTPRFLAKWVWAFEGCNEVVDISNRWRVSRGAGQLRISVTG